MRAQVSLCLLREISTGNQGRECGWAALKEPQPSASPRRLRAEPAFLPKTPPSRGRGCRMLMAADAASPVHGTASRGAGWGRGGGREEGRETIFGTSKKYLRRHLAALFVCRAGALLHHYGRACRNRCSHVCTCTHPALCAVYTRGDTTCPTACRPPAACVGALPCPGAQPGPPACAPATQNPVVPRGQDGPSALPAPSAVRELGQLSPWGGTVLARPVPWHRAVQPRPC